MISDKMVEAAFRSEMPDALSRVISRRHIRALLTAALSAASCNCPGEGRPAASGVHPDALPDGTLSKSTAKRLAAESVSERARHGVVRATVRATDEDDVLHIECRFDDGQKYAAIETSGHRCEELAGFIVSALEQALTQQRVECEAVDRDAWAETLELPEGYTVEEFLPGGWHYAWTRADGERMVSGTTWNHPALAAIAAWQYAPATTPQPSASAMEPGALRALVTAANAVLAENPADDGMWTLEQAVRPFNATMPAECANGCPTNQVCDYCQYAPQPSADAVRELVEALQVAELALRERGLRACGEYKQIAAAIAKASNHQQNAAQGGGEK